MQHYGRGQQAMLACATHHKIGGKIQPHLRFSPGGVRIRFADVLLRVLVANLPVYPLACHACSSNPSFFRRAAVWEGAPYAVSHTLTSVRDNALSSWLPNAEQHQAQPQKRHIGFIGY